MLLAAAVACCGAVALLAPIALPRLALIASLVIVTAVVAFERFHARLEARKGMLVWVAALVAAAVALAAAALAAEVLRLSPFASFAVLAAGACAALGIRELAIGGLPSAREVRPPAARSRLLIAAGVFLGSVAVSLVVRAGFSTMIAPDTESYFMTPADVFLSIPDQAPIRTPQYSLLIVLVQLLGGKGTALLLAQFVLRAAASAYLAWLLTSRGLAAGVVVGLLLALDPVSATTSASYLSESLYTTGLVFSCALALDQLTRPTADLRRRALVAAGFGFGVALLVRPSSAPLIVAVVTAYLIATRSIAKAALVAGGYGAIALAIAVFNYVRTGLFVVVTTGLYTAFPLFIHHLMVPANGPASATIDRVLRQCDPAIDYSSVSAATSNAFVHEKVTLCVFEWTGRDRVKTYSLFARAYREAALARPVTFTWRLSIETLRFLGTRLADYAEEVARVNQAPVIAEVCQRPSGFSPTVAAFVCPIPRQDARLTGRIVMFSDALRFVYQPYFLVYAPRLHGRSPDDAAAPEVVGAAAVLFVLAALWICRRAYRPAMAASIVMILFNAAVTGFGQVTLRRYVAPLSPFFLVVSGLLLVSLGEEATAIWRSARARERS